MKVVVDLDSVLMDAISKYGALSAQIGGRDKPCFYKDSYDLSDIFSVDGSRLNVLIAQQSPEFWVEVEPYPWARQLMTALYSITSLVVVMSECHSYNAVIGKTEWVRKNIPTYPELLFSTCKNIHNIIYLPSRPIVISGDPILVNTFRRFGGKCILFPQPWNDSESRRLSSLFSLSPLIKIRPIVKSVATLMEDTDEDVS